MDLVANSCVHKPETFHDYNSQSHLITCKICENIVSKISSYKVLPGKYLDIV